MHKYHDKHGAAWEAYRNTTMVWDRCDSLAVFWIMSAARCRGATTGEIQKGTGKRGRDRNLDGGNSALVIGF